MVMMRSRVKPEWLCVANTIIGGEEVEKPRGQALGRIINVDTEITENSNFYRVVLERVTVTQALESSRYLEKMTSHSREEEWFDFRDSLDQVNNLNTGYGRLIQCHLLIIESVLTCRTFC